MRQFLLCFLLAMPTLAAFAQPGPLSQGDIPPNNYLIKSHRQKVAANALLIGGSVVVLTSAYKMISIFNGEHSIVTVALDPNADRRFTAWSYVFTAGGGMMVGSVPLYFAARRNARAGAPHLSLQLLAQPLPPLANGPPAAYPAVGLNLRL
ncbi:hypothetical protein [Hymenobacter elongatus]|uniref:DUF4134 domain-containing protein n=1 Tax=Hymenobacter elongatus TaxID=877208 RepID=A0A4Z0PRA1_9BACT|nr:hypothetical protein [Hymenobacter elongatus]TGE18944.1 hypothetical protein E5J99_04165 [Hymenobacter elongatus]